ncbi:MAG: TIGR03668 family PPOX class F420-dependent oxidoreductase [Actinomycetota bacterium]
MTGGPPENFASLLRARRGYLATLGAEGFPHVLPVCFTWAGDTVWTAIDGKRKAGSPLQRLADVQPNSKVSFMVDRWDEDWTRLAWLQARGKARQISKGPEAEKAIEALKSKYSQYSDTTLEGPVLSIEVERWLSWEA